MALPPPPPPQQFCVRWNSYHTNLQAVFPRLLLTEQFADVTLACESRQLRCHKLVLSACSGYLERLLLQNPCKHPIVLMRDMRFSEMQALVDFMYKGEVNVTQEELPSLLKSAEALQIRGLCSGDTSGVSAGLPARSDFNTASDALVAAAAAPTTNGGGVTPSPKPSSGKKRKSEAPHSPSDRPDVKEETVEEDGLYYGELENDQMEYNEDEEPDKPGSSIGQPSESDFAIANVQCQYDSDGDAGDSVASDGAAVGQSGRTDDHTYNARDEPPPHLYNARDEPPAFLIQNLNNQSSFPPKLPLDLPGVNVIRVDHQPQLPQPPSIPSWHQVQHTAPPEFSKRVRRSEAVLRAAADCVSRGLTFQTASEQFNIPISTIRFFMARKGILPRRRRGRSAAMERHESHRQCTSPEPPYHMQHYKLPDMIALHADDDGSTNANALS